MGSHFNVLYCLAGYKKTKSLISNHFVESIIIRITCNKIVDSDVWSNMCLRDESFLKKKPPSALVSLP